MSREEEIPTGSVEPIVVADRLGIAAVANAGMADEQVGDLNGCHQMDVVRSPLGMVMVSGYLHQNIGQLMVGQVNGTQFGMVHP